MSDSTPTTCPRCGAAIPAGATDPLCPACLLSGALAAGDETVPTGMGQSTAPREPDEFPFEFGAYRLLGLLGQGGMGSVYDAEHVATARRVALKMLGQQLDSAEMRQRFLREGRLAAGVSHPNSLYVFGSEEIDGVPVITMEIAAGGTLKDKLKKRGPLPTREAVDAILDVVAGLEAAFAAGVLHRDIKPSNCFVSPDGSVKIGDFGLSVSTLAKEDTYVTASGVIMGTPAYASPEQLRGDELDLRADIYSVGATLFTLLTGRAPFGGENAIQVVANAVNQEPQPVRELREDVPPGLGRVVTRCLSKSPDGRFSDYTALREALLPFSSREPDPAPLTIRSAAGWVDYLIAFLPPYVTLMLVVGGDELLVRPLVDRTLYSARWYLTMFAVGFLYFGIAEGVWGAGLGKWLKGLRVVRTNGRPPGFGRALIRIALPILCVEGVRMPLTMTFISESIWTGFQTAMFVVAAIVCGWAPVLLMLRARRENGFATVWDLVSGTRVVVKPKGSTRPSIEPAVSPGDPAARAAFLGPYQITTEMVPGKWLVAFDPVLHRQVWLLRRDALELPLARRDLARGGRLRWLQKVETIEATWDAFEGTPGAPFSSLIADGNRVPWGTLRHWLHDLAAELGAAAGDETLPAELSLDHVWITAQGRAVLLDEPWPAAKPAERIPVGDVAGQQRFLSTIARHVESTGVPVHARPVLRNLQDGKFEKPSFLTGVLRGILEKPAEVSRGIRAGAIFLVPFYVWITLFVGTYEGAEWLHAIVGSSMAAIALTTAAFVLVGAAVIQLLTLPLRTTVGHAVFRLAVVDSKGEPAGVARLLSRWATIWVPLLLPMALLALLWDTAQLTALIAALALVLLWVGAAAYAALGRNRGLHDRVAGTWVVRR